MKKPTHTPGPWSTPGLDGGARVASARVNGKANTIAHVYSHLSLDMDADEYNGQQEANAHLIASAPELLGALEALFEHCAMVHKYWGDGDNQKEADAAISRAQDAIRKAKGDSDNV